MPKENTLKSDSWNPVRTFRAEGIPAEGLCWSLYIGQGNNTSFCVWGFLNGRAGTNTNWTSVVGT